MRKRSEEIGELLKRHNATMSTAESCTGGNIAHNITEVPGSSMYFKESVVSYCNEVKHNVIGVKQETLDTYTAVSEETAKEMAEGVKRVMNTDFSVSTTGIAGPGGATETQKVGTAWMATATPAKTSAQLFHFDGDREMVIEKATAKALEILEDKIREYYG